jgi:nucleotide-binding universal stress UspA family protein
MEKKIVIGFDGSDGSWRALKEAARLAAAEHSELRIVSIEELSSFPATVGEVMEEQESKESRFHKLHEEAVEVGLRAGASSVKADIKIGHPAKALLDFTESVGADLLVVGHSGHSGVWGTFLGTTADKIVCHAKCSVLIVR